MKYAFIPAKTCEMCGSPPSEHRLLGARLNRSQGRRPHAQSGITVSVKKCRRCDLIFPDPMPVPESISDHYAKPAEDYWKPKYFEYDPAYFRTEIETAKRLIAFTPGMTALDIGAGIGKAMKALDDAGFQSFGIEPSAPFREKAIDAMGIHPDRLQLGSIEEANFELGSFDFVTFGAVLEHLYAPASAITRALSWLKPGGVIQIEVPSSHHAIAKLVNLFYKLMGTNYVTNLSPMHQPYHLHEFGLKSFELHGRRSGYRVVDHHFQVCTIYNIPSAFHGILRKYMERTNTGLQLTVWLGHAGVGVSGDA